jgi:hypothetical protein
MLSCICFRYVIFFLPFRLSLRLFVLKGLAAAKGRLTLYVVEDTERTQLAQSEMTEAQ